MEDSFRFKQFSVRHRDSALKLGTDAVLLGAAMNISGNERLALDIGTGCGVIALMAAQRAPGCRFVGIDIDEASAREAAFNFASSPWPERLEARHCPLSGFESAEKFDLIFSNPPYYDDSLKNPDAREAAARHTDSLSFAEIFEFCREQLEANGQLSLILPCDSLQSVRRTGASFGFYPRRILYVQTVERKQPKRAIAEFSRQRIEAAEERLILQKDGSRSEQYSRLCEDFYL